jgi:aspartyl-tRNA(Asn)/glutamyl-tRNA(Gln) amidotransferase subunit B
LSAKLIYEEMARAKRSDPEAIMREKGLEQVSDEGELESVIRKVLDENTSELGRYRQGQTKLLGFFVGQVMKVSGGTADPKRVGEMLKKMLE